MQISVTIFLAIKFKFLDLKHEWGLRKISNFYVKFVLPASRLSGTFIFSHHISFSACSVSTYNQISRRGGKTSHLRAVKERISLNLSVSLSLSPTCMHVWIRVRVRIHTHIHTHRVEEGSLLANAHLEFRMYFTTEIIRNSNNVSNTVYLHCGLNEEFVGWLWKPVWQHYIREISSLNLNSCFPRTLLEYFGLCGSGTACPVQGCAWRFGREEEQGICRFHWETGPAMKLLLHPRNRLVAPLPDIILIHLFACLFSKQVQCVSWLYICSLHNIF